MYSNFAATFADEKAGLWLESPVARDLLRKALFLFFALGALFGFAFVLRSIFDAAVDVPTAEQVIKVFDLHHGVVDAIFPEPAENLTFLVSLAFGAIAIAGAAHKSKRAAWPSTQTDYSATAALLGLVLIAAPFAIDWSTIAAPRSKLLDASESYLVSTTLAGLAFALAICAAQRRGCSIVGSLALAAFAWLPAFTLTSNFDPLVALPHFEVVAYPIAQDWLGAALLLDQPTQYGLYPIFLRPIWSLFEPDPTAISAVMAVLTFISLAGFLLLSIRIARHKDLVAAVVLATVAFTLLYYPFWPGEAYQQIFPIRLIFPAFACLFTMVPTGGRRSLRLFAYTALGLGVFWNPESGLAALCMLFAWRVVSSASPLSTARSEIALMLAGMSISLAAASAYFLWRFGAVPDWRSLLRYQGLFSSGVYALPMVRNGAWLIHAAIYATAAFVVMRSLFVPGAERERRRCAALAMYLVLGILFIRYYQGRSHPLVLVFSSLPAGLCLALLIDRLPVLERTSNLVAAGLAATVLAMLAAWAHTNPVPQRDWKFIQSAASISTIDKKIESLLAIGPTGGSPGSVVAITPYAYLLNLRLGAPSPIRAAGMCQIWFADELGAIDRTVRSADTRLVVIDESLPCAIHRAILPGTWERLRSDYRSVDVAGFPDSGRLLVFERLPSDAGKLGEKGRLSAALPADRLAKAAIRGSPPLR